MLAAMSTAERAGARKFITTLGGTVTENMMKAVTAWFRQESGSVAKVIGNNPFNIRPGAATKLSNGLRTVPGNGVFLTFPSLAVGFQAAAVVLAASGGTYGYDHAIAALKRGDPIGFLAKLAESSWCASHYGIEPICARSKHNHLVAVFGQIP
jgi:hypothetical protein